MADDAAIRGDSIDVARSGGGDASPHTILLVDDEPAILESLEFTLGGDYRVLAATTAEGGLEILEREGERVSLIITDQVLASMSGVEFLERAIEINPRAIRMMLTGFADVGSLTRAINEGHIYRYISKPWEPDSRFPNNLPNWHASLPRCTSVVIFARKCAR